MTTITQTLFGLNPSAVKQQENDYADVMGLRLASVEPGRAFVALAPRAGLEAGRAVGNLLGVQDPAAQEATAVQQIASDLQAKGLNLQSAEGLQMLAQNLAQNGFQKSAALAAQEAMKYQKSQLDMMKTQSEIQKNMGEGAKFSKVNPADYTPESLKRFTETGDYAVLEARPREQNANEQSLANIRQQLIQQYGPEAGERMFQEYANRFKAEELAIQKNSKDAETKPLPAPALKMVNELTDQLATASSIKTDLKVIESQINSGKLSFGPLSNLVNRGLNATGASTEESRNFASFQATLEKLRNDSLRLNNGVQTEGDSQRAWNELFASINDKKLVKQRLVEIQKINERAATLKKNQLDGIYSNFGKATPDLDKFTNVKPAVGAKPASNNSKRPSLADIFGK